MRYLGKIKINDAFILIRQRKREEFFTKDIRDHLKVDKDLTDLSN